MEENKTARYNCAHCGASVGWLDHTKCGFCGYWLCKNCWEGNCPKKSSNISIDANALRYGWDVYNPDKSKYGDDTYNPDKP